MLTDDSSTPEYQFEGDAEEQPDEVERHLAHFAFVREERDREVRLLFRDVPAPEIAQTFFAAGAGLISVSGERVSPDLNIEPYKHGHDDVEMTNHPHDALALDDEDTYSLPTRRSRRRNAHNHEAGQPPGELTVRYFFALGETVYTVSIAVPSGVVGSVAGIYPAAKLPERELQKRLGAVFT